MTSLTPESINTELLRDAMLALEQLTTSISVLALSATTHQEQGPRVRRLLEDLLWLIQEVEAEVGTYADC